MTGDEILIVGRGPSIRGFDFPDMPIMAVSSGIFAVPEHKRPPEHFVSMDFPKWFIGELHLAETTNAWQHDEHAPWAFWSDERIAKHIPSERILRGYYRTMPGEVYDVIPPEAQDAFRRQLLDNLHKFSFQPGWGDFSNVRGWEFHHGGPSFSDGPIGMIGHGGDGMIRNSWFMAVQVAYRLGYRRLYFAGCDFNGDDYKPHRARLKPWYKMAQDAGMEWVCLTPESALSDVIPTRACAAV